MFLWSLVVDKLAHGNSVVAMYPSDVLVFSLVAVFILAMFAWSGLRVACFARETLTVGFIGLVVLFAVGVIGAWQGIRVCEQYSQSRNISYLSCYRSAWINAVADSGGRCDTTKTPPEHRVRILTAHHAAAAVPSLCG